MYVHFIGIGGIGVSAIARMMLSEGHQVSGSDLATSIITDELAKLGAKIFVGQRASNIKKPDLVIYTPALKRNNPELLTAKKSGAELYSYPEMLGRISADKLPHQSFLSGALWCGGKYTIAVAGAHGKTTTTAMIGKILLDAKLSPTVIVGSLLTPLETSRHGRLPRSRGSLTGLKGTNFIAGKSNYFVVEACEYKKSFLNINPTIAVITNIDNDHLDYYGNIVGVIKGFGEFVAKVPAKGFIVCNPRDPYVARAIKRVRGAVVDYTRLPQNLKLKIPGAHNIKNAQAALAVAKLLKVPIAKAKKSLESYAGTWRRFEYKGKTRNGALIYDDYGHHPTEIKATLKAARELFPKKNIICVFQPHLFSRTKILLNDFAKSFNDADIVMVSDIYAAREKQDKSINSEQLVNKIKKYHSQVLYSGSLAKTLALLRRTTLNGSVVITMGAGDVYKIGESLISNY